MKRVARGFSLIELLVVVAIILIIAAIAIPSYLRSKMAANEAAAASNVRALSTASTVYSTTWSNGYPPSLATLGGTAITATCNQAELLNSSMTSPPNQQSGYTFGYIPQGPALTVVIAGCAAPGYNSYLATAKPITVGYTGQRSFCSDLPGVIHFDLTGASITSTSTCDALPTL